MIHARIAALRREYLYEVRVWQGTAEDGEPDLMFAFPHKASLLSADRYAQNLGTALWAFLIRGSTLPSEPAERLRIEKCDKASGNETSGALFYAVHTGKTPNQSTRSSDPGFSREIR
jgi:hypothetical protein